MRARRAPTRPAHCGSLGPVIHLVQCLREGGGPSVRHSVAILICRLPPRPARKPFPGGRTRGRMSTIGLEADAASRHPGRPRPCRPARCHHSRKGLGPATRFTSATGLQHADDRTDRKPFAPDGAALRPPASRRGSDPCSATAHEPRSGCPLQFVRKIDCADLLKR